MDFGDTAVQRLPRGDLLLTPPWGLSGFATVVSGCLQGRPGRSEHAARRRWPAPPDGSGLSAILTTAPTVRSRVTMSSHRPPLDVQVVEPDPLRERGLVASQPVDLCPPGQSDR